jgi:hypothetical protein
MSLHPEQRNFIALFVMLGAVGWFLFELAVCWSELFDSLVAP